MIVENKYESLDLWLTAVEEQDYQMYRFEDETSIRYEAFSSEARLAGWYNMRPHAGVLREEKRAERNHQEG